MESPVPLMIERLKTLTELKKVAGMVTIEAMLQQALPSPSCFVYHTVDHVLELLDSQRVVELVDTVWAASVVFKNVKITDDIMPDEAEIINKKIIELLTGWIPFNEGFPLIYRGSKPLFEQNRLIRVNLFSLKQVLEMEYRE